MVLTTLSFIKPLNLYETEKPYFLNIAGDGKAPDIIKSNLEYVSHDGIEIEDIRQHDLSHFTLEEHGFQVLTKETMFSTPIDPTEVEAYCDETARLVSAQCGATHVVCYDYRIRENVAADHGDYERSQNHTRSAAAPPVFPVHIDHTIEGGPERIRRHLTAEEASTYVNDKYRARIINVWRPLWNTVEDCPIAICHPRSVEPHDLLPADRVTPNFVVKLYYLKHNPDQKWYWLRKQTTHELLAFVNYDSSNKADGPHWLTCPHAAFKNPEAEEGAPQRASIEIRLIVFTMSA